MSPRNRLVIVASTTGTLFEWYDFFVYGTLAAVIGAKFFPSGDATVSFLAALATFGAGFMVRPLGGLIFGAIGDRWGRKYTFLITISVMGVATLAVGLVPTYDSIGLWATASVVALRLVQGLALGGEFGGAAVYIAEHAPDGQRGFYTSWIQVSAVGGFLLSLAVVFGCQTMLGAEAFDSWGWRLPFLVSIVLLLISIFIRLKLQESPVFQLMNAEGRVARQPIRETFGSWSNVRLMLTGSLGVVAGLAVIWYTVQFSTFYFLQGPARVDSATARLLIGAASLAGVPLVILSGWLSDRIGRKRLLVAGYCLTLITLQPLFHQMALGANPQLMAAMHSAPVTVAGTDCEYDLFSSTQHSPCAKALAYLSARGVSFRLSANPSTDVAVKMGTEHIEGFDPTAYDRALSRAGYTQRADVRRMDLRRIMLALLGMTVLSAMTYSHAAAIMVELFPARIRYTSMSVAYNFGAASFGGFLPFVSQFINVKAGNAFAGLWYTLGVVAMALIVALAWLPESKNHDIRN